MPASTTELLDRVSREPSASELKPGTEFIQARLSQRSTRDEGKPEDVARHLALTDFCQALFALNEFIYVD